MRVALRSALSVAFVAALASSLALGLVAACASDDPAGARSPADAGSDALLLGDVTPPAPDADVPLGDLCGDAQGLEPGAPWPLRGGCPKRAGASTNTGPQNATVKWSVDLPAGESSPAVAADRLVWVGTADHDVVVLSPDGTVQAALHTGAAVRSSPARSATGLTIIGGSDGSLYGVDRIFTPDAGADGGDASTDDGGDDGGSAFRPARAVFTRALAPIVSSPAIGGDGTIYVTTTAGKLVAVAADGSATKWDATTNDTLGTSSPAIALDGTIYVGSSDGKLYAFTRDGAAKWTLPTGAAISGSPVIGGDDTIYVGSTDGKLYAVTPEGKPKWAYATGGPITGAPSVRGGLVYVGSDDKKLHAVSTQTGELRWTYATLAAVATPVVGGDATVYVGSADGYLYALTPKGSLYFAVNAKGSIRSAPALSDDGTLYVTTDKAILAIGP